MSAAALAVRGGAALRASLAAAAISRRWRLWRRARVGAARRGRRAGCARLRRSRRRWSGRAARGAIPGAPSGAGCSLGGAAVAFAGGACRVRAARGARRSRPRGRSPSRACSRARRRALPARRRRRRAARWRWRSPTRWRRPLAPRGARRGGARARPARPGTSCAAPPPSWPPARRPRTRSRRCAGAARSPRHGRARGRLPAPAARRAATSRGCCATAPARSRTRRGSRTRCARPPRRRASPALVVVLLPLGGALLAELASPGWFAGLWSSFLTAWLVGIALVLQVVAAVLMSRLARVRW